MTSRRGHSTLHCPTIAYPEKVRNRPSLRLSYPHYLLLPPLHFSAVEIADDLRKLILEIYDEHLSPDGFVSRNGRHGYRPLPPQAVDYKGISTSPKFEEYVRATAELKRVDIINLTREEKLALFINIYNALVIHAFVVQGPPTNTLRRLLVRKEGEWAWLNAVAIVVESIDRFYLPIILMEVL